jgi:xanthine dehydrogenase accessory factor
MAADHLWPGDRVVIVTRDHELDYRILREALQKKTAYIGLIGGKLKRKTIYQKLREQDSVSEEQLKQIHSPIGLDIAAETPQEIALSIAAELIKEKNGQ